MEPALTAVNAIVARCPGVVALPHVVRRISAFLFTLEFSCWSLESASKRGHVRLLDRLLNLESPGFNQKCRELRLNWVIQDCVERGYDPEVVDWWFRCYMPNQQRVSMADIFKIAIEHAQLPVLEWIYEETQSQLPVPRYPPYCLDPEVAVWLHEHGGLHSLIQLSLYRYIWPSDDCFEFVKQCFGFEDKTETFKIKHAFKAVTQAIERGQLDALQWLQTHRLKLFETDYLDYAVHYGRINVAKWLKQSFPKHYFSDPQNTFQDSVVSGPFKFDFDTIQWTAREYDWKDQNARLYWLEHAIIHAADTGKLELLDFAYTFRQEIVTKLRAQGEVGDIGETRDLIFGPHLMDDAASRGFDSIVQWLLKHKCQGCTTNAMDDAAAYGHLNIVEWLHQYRSEGCTTDALDGAAASGHLEIVQWLHSNRTEGCTVYAIDAAAENGHLKVVQWLHQHRTEGCTSEAMDMAAQNGHLDVVQFLHTNRSEGCTIKAMSSAALNGHLAVVQFLYVNRQMQCTSAAMESAAAKGHLTVFQWLYDHKLEEFTPEMANWEENDLDAYHRILKCQALYTDQSCLGSFIDQFIEINDFETVELLLSRARAKGATSMKSSYVEFL